MNPASQIRVEELSKNQQRLFTEVGNLYEQTNVSLCYYQDIQSSPTSLSESELYLHMAAMAFNVNILSGKTAKLINKTILLSDSHEGPVFFYCYGLTGRPWEFVVHATCYNLPVALIDVRAWQMYKDDEVLGFDLRLNILAMKLKIIAVDIIRSEKITLAKLGTFSSLLVSSFYIRTYLYFNYIPRLLQGRKNRKKYLTLLKHITLARPHLNLAHIIDSIQNTFPRESWDGNVLLTKDKDNFGHYIWNDALGIVTMCQYMKLPHNLFLLEGPYDFASNIQLLNWSLPTYRLSLDNIRCDFWCRYPVLALRSLPILPSAASQLAIHLINENASSNNSSSPSHNSTLIESANPRIFQTHLYVVFTIRLGGRPWLNSHETIVAISSFLKSLQSNIYFIIDGMTFFPSMKTKHVEIMHSEIALSSKIQRELQKNGCDCSIITGLDLSTKMAYYKMAGLFIQPIGSGDTIPRLILNKPVISFGSPELIRLQEDVSRWRSDIRRPVAIEVDDPDHTGYSLDPEQVIKVILENNDLIGLFKI